MSRYYYPEERIAIVGMGGLFPHADNVQIFWENVLDKKVSIKDVPDHMIHSNVFYRPEARGKISKNNKTYTKIAAILDVENYAELSKKFRIPPAVAEHMDPNQHVALYCVDQALQTLKGPIPKERTAVILGNGAPGRSYNNIIKRNYYSRIEYSLLNNPRLTSHMKKDDIEKLLYELSEDVLKETIPVTEDSAPGMLQNIIAARVTNVFDFQGPSFVVDAACASTLAATCCAVTGLLSGEYDAAVVGAAEVTMDENPLVVFSGNNTLSAEGSFPFDSRANGFVTGVGGGVLILKRLGDALRDNDNIFALVSGFGQGSDGKGKYIAAPNEDGQTRVIENACQMAGYPVDTIELIEAHGTGTIVGDVVEISALKKAFTNLGVTRQNFCGVGSVKSNIGHLRYAAGVPGLIKASMALNNKILPPTANIKEINPKLGLEKSPFYILTDKKEWSGTSLHPRRANVSAYGFGGADYHIAMEEFRPEFLKKSYGMSNLNINATMEHRIKNTDDSKEFVYFSGNTIKELDELYKKFNDNAKDGRDFKLNVFLHNLSVMVRKDLRFAISAGSFEELKEKWIKVNEFLKEGKYDNDEALSLKGIFFGKGERAKPENIAWMFPGQASQYSNMLSELYENCPSIRSLYAQADTIWNSKYEHDISSLIFGSSEEDINKQLKNTKNTHPAVFLSNIAMYRLLRDSGVRADYMIGHSLGEISAIHASGMLDLKSSLELIGARGGAFDGIDENKRGRMISIRAEIEKTQEIICKSGLDIHVANINSPEQTVVGGSEEELSKLAEILGQQGTNYTELNVSHAFHTYLMSEAADVFYEKIKDICFETPCTKVMACHKESFYPQAQNEIQDMPVFLKEQILSPVKFIDSVKKLYDEGVRVFLETGPSSVLSSLVKNILAGKDVKVIASNNRNKNSVECYKQALAELFACGIEICQVPFEGVHQLPSRQEHTEENCKETCVVNPIGSNSTDSTKESIVYSGVSIGLPGSFKEIFSEDNFKLLMEGKNLIEMLTDCERENLLDLNITRLIKTEGITTFKKISAINEVIQLAAKFGKLDMPKDYLVDEKDLRQMTITWCAAVAAGYEALKDAGIPLIREYVKTSTVALLPGRLVLPEEMQEGTGVIFANGFLGIEPFISEVSKYIAYKFGKKTRNDLIDFYESVITKVSDRDVKKLLTDWFSLHYSRLLYNGGEEDVYEFSKDFMASISSRANNRLAQFIGAKGPNFHISAACSSTASSVTIAEDMIRGGHAERMIIIGAEDPTSKEAFPWIGGSFLCMGAATSSSDVYKAAIPFDNRRSGMIIGSGAVGLIIEKEKDVSKRGMNGICRIVGTHVFNTAGHQTKVDSARHSIELDKFMSRLEKQDGINRMNIASNTVYYSNETYSSKKGGCSYAEKAALKKNFGEGFRDIKIINTKGMTGHTMGASVEEAVAAKALQYQQIPPVVNFREPDPELEGLNLSRGGSYKFEYILRMVAAYGGQGNYHLLQKIASGDDRICDNRAYAEWLKTITSSEEGQLKKYGRLLVAEGTGNRIDSKAYSNFEQDGKEEAVATSLKENASDRQKVSLHQSDVESIVLEIYSAVTKYPKEVLDLSMEIEADLGIDTVKQATVISMLAEKFDISPSEAVKISDFKTIGQIVKMVQEKAGTGKNETIAVTDTIDSSPSFNASARSCTDEILEIISEITKYPVNMLDIDMEMEADLGIDTVKQATVFSIICEKYSINADNAVNISSYRTIASLIDFVKSRIGDMENILVQNGDILVQNENIRGEIQQPVEIIGGSPGVMEIERSIFKTDAKTDAKGVEQETLDIISGITGYPVEILENDMEIEADLGIDTVKQATILSLICEKFGISVQENINISQLTTIGKLIDFVKKACNTELQDSSCVEKETGVQSPHAEPTLHKELGIQIPVFIEKKAESKDFSLKGKNILVIGDNQKTVEMTVGHLGSFTENIKKFLFDTIKEQELESRVIEAFKSPVDVILDCTSIGISIDFDSINRDEEEKMLFNSSEARFVFYKKVMEIIPEPQFRIVCAVSTDGSFGYTEGGSAGEPFYGALCGFYKGLRKEWPKSVIKIIDIGAKGKSGIKKDEVLLLADELKVTDNDYEIGFTGGKRRVLAIDYLDKAEMKKINMEKGTHYFITGGGSGITAEVLKHVSQELEGSFTIIGRTRLPKDIEELVLLDEDSLNKKKTEIYERLLESGRKATPAIIEEEYNNLLKAISVFNLLKEIEKMGSRALYIPCDVRDYDGLRTAVNEAEGKFGPVRAVIYAAGIEKSRLFAQKSMQEFRDVFSVKARGICNLYRLIDKEKLKVFLVFSSISGRFGNESQIDYCAANSFINSFIEKIRSSNKSIHALSIAWSGWKETGMAWRNEFVRKHSEELGMNLIEPDRGACEFVNLMTHRLSVGEVILSKGLGDFADKRMFCGDYKDTPLIDWVTKKGDIIEKAFKIFSVKRDPIIDQHRLGTTPIMPGVGFMEMLAEHHRLNFGISKHYIYRNIKFHTPMKFYHEKPGEIILVSRLAREPRSMEAVFYTHFETKFGVSKLTELNSMAIGNIPGDYEYLYAMKDIENESMEEGYTRGALEALNSKTDQSMRLGPLFVDGEKESNVFKRNEKGAVYSIKLPKEQTTNPGYPLDKFLTNPSFMDSIFQACSVHTQLKNDRVFLPWEVEEFGVLKAPRELCGYKAYTKVKDEDDECKVYDAVLMNEHGEICYYAKNVVMRRINL